MLRFVAAAVVAVAIVAVGRPVTAHHSFAAQYDRDKTITLKGTVTSVEWMNPHVYFYMDVKDDAGIGTVGHRGRRADVALPRRLAEGLPQGRRRRDRARPPRA